MVRRCHSTYSEESGLAWTQGVCLPRALSSRDDLGLADPKPRDWDIVYGDRLTVCPSACVDADEALFEEPDGASKLFRLFLDPEVDPFWIVEVGEVKGS